MVTHEDVLQMARLSKLYIKEEELDALTKIWITSLHLLKQSALLNVNKPTLIISTIFPMYYGKTLWFLLTTEKKF